MLENLEKARVEKALSGLVEWYDMVQEDLGQVCEGTENIISIAKTMLAGKGVKSACEDIAACSLPLIGRRDLYNRAYEVARLLELV